MHKDHGSELTAEKYTELIFVTNNTFLLLANLSQEFYWKYLGYFIENVKYYTTQNTPSCLTGTNIINATLTAKLLSLNWYKLMHILVKSFHVSSYVGIQKYRNVEMQK